MEIKYLKKMQKYPTLRTWTNEGMSITEIELLEEKYNNNQPFPVAYREFLFIGGNHSNLGDIDTGFGYEWMQETAKMELVEYGQSIDRPFWVTDQLDACTQFGFIYLDEGVEDPVIYNAFPAYVESGDPLIKPRPQGKFSNYINVCIDRAIETDKYMDK